MQTLPYLLRGSNFLNKTFFPFSSQFSRFNSLTGTLRTPAEEFLRLNQPRSQVEAEHSRMSRGYQKPFVNPSEERWEPQSGVFISESHGLPSSCLKFIRRFFEPNRQQHRTGSSSKTKNSVNFVRNAKITTSFCRVFRFAVLDFIRDRIHSNGIPSVTSLPPLMTWIRLFIGS